MADRGREDSVGESTEPRRQADTVRPQQDDDEEGTRPQGPSCPECASAPLTLLRDAAIVSVYKCPRCGHLSAPVKKN
jgi:hypothetical protein